MLTMQIVLHLLVRTHILVVALTLYFVYAVGLPPTAVAAEEDRFKFIVQHKHDYSSEIKLIKRLPNENNILSVSDNPYTDNSVMKLWDATSGRLVRSFSVAPRAARRIVISPNGTIWLSFDRYYNYDLEVHAIKCSVWELESGKLLRSFKVEDSDIGLFGLPAAFAPDGKHVVISGDYPVLVDIATGKIIRSYKRNDLDTIRSLVFSPDGTRLLAATVENFFVWDAKNGALIHRHDFKRRFFSIDDHIAAFSPDRKFFLAVRPGDSESESLTLWDIAAGDEVRTFYWPNFWAYDGILRFWDWLSGNRYGSQPTPLFKGHFSPIDAIAYSPDGARIASGGYDGYVKIWDANTGALISSAVGKPYLFANITSLEFSSDGEKVFVGNDQGELDLRDIETGATLHQFGRKTQEINVVAFSHDAKQLIAGGRYDLRAFNAKTAQQQFNLGLPDKKDGIKRWFLDVQSIAVSPVGGRMAMRGVSRDIELWDSNNVKPISALKAWGPVFSPDGRFLAAISGTDNKTNFLGLWDSSTGEFIKQFRNISGPIAYSPNGEHILGVGRDGNELILFDAATGKALREIGKTENAINSVSYAPNGRLIASIDAAKVNLWDAATGNRIEEFEGPRSGNAIAFSTDSRQFVYADDNGNLRLWDVGTLSPLRSLKGHLSKVNSVAFSPDGRFVLSGGDDAMILWSASSGEILSRFYFDNEGNWIVVTPEGFFSASSPKGTELLSVVNGKDAHSLSQFWQALYRPDLVVEKLAGDPRGIVRKAAATLNLAKILDSGLAPIVHIVSHKSKDVSESDLVNVSAEVLAQGGGGIGRVEWRVDGVTVASTEASRTGASYARIVHEQSIALGSGENIVQCVVYNSAGLVASAPAQTNITWTGKRPTAPPKLHVLALGVNNYKMGRLRLKFATQDATAISAALKNANNGKSLFEDVVVTLMLDEQVTIEKLDRVFADIGSQIRPRDVFVFFAAGHGVTRDGRYYFIPHDFRYDTEGSILKNGIGQEKWQQWFAQIPAKKSLLMFDTCESGTLAGGAEIAFNTRGGFEEMAAVGRLIEATGRSVLAASLGNQPALEGYSGHGVFTYAVLEALKKGDLSGNGYVELTELTGHIDRVVPEITDRLWNVRQFPQKSVQGLDFPIAEQVASSE